MFEIQGQFTAILLLLGTLHHCQGANVTDIRLANSQQSGRFGLIEIQVDGKVTWGNVCDDQWERNDANAIVACRQLGFTNGGTAELSGKYGAGTSNFLLDDTDCAADMSSLAQCRSAQQSDCGAADKAVGLECNAVSGQGVTTFKPPTTTTAASGVISDNCQNTNPTVRLQGKKGVPGMGFVEVKNPRTQTWGFVCDDGWDAQAAKVVCAQLCFPTNYTAKPGIPAEHRVLPANPKITLDTIQCDGTEATLQDCKHNNFATTNDCSVDKDELAGVQCVKAQFSPPQPPDPVLECGGGVMKASFSRDRDRNLEEKHLSVLGDKNCADVTKSTTNQFVSIAIPVDKCGTDISRNGSHIIYKNEVRYASTSNEGSITRINTYRVGLLCALPVNIAVTQRVQAVTEAVQENSNGDVTMSMVIFRSDSFENPVTANPVHIPLGEWLNMAIIMEKYDPRLKLVVTDCVSTPTGDTSNTRLTKVLFEDKCIMEPTLSFYPLSNSEFAFRFKPFKFVNFPLLYIQCSALVCLTADVTNECDRTCNNTKPVASSRKRRAVVNRQLIESQAILIYNPHSPGTDFGSSSIKKESEITVVIGNNGEEEEMLGVKSTLPPIVQQETPPSAGLSVPPASTSSSASSSSSHLNADTNDETESKEFTDEKDLHNGISPRNSAGHLSVSVVYFPLTCLFSFLMLFHLNEFFYYAV